MGSTDGRKLEQLNTLIELSAVINSTLDTYEIRKRSIEAAVRLIGAEAGSLLLLDSETGELYFEVALGEKGSRLKEIRLRPGQGIAGWVALNREHVISHDPMNDPRFFRDADLASEFTTRSLVCVPVESRGAVLGVLQAVNKLEGEFDREDVEILLALANHIAVAIENAGLYRDLRETFLSTVEALSETIEKRDPYTGGHTRRVKEYSLAIGREMGLGRNELEELHLSAILHDIGKIGIRDAVLLKADTLSSDEFEEMTAHSGFGVEILSHIKRLDGLMPAIRSHHEKVDGTGYPDRIGGGEIPLHARILAVADAFDAMTSDRPYRKGRSIEDALAELREFSGSQFDPAIVDTFIRLWDEKGMGPDGPAGEAGRG
jgi:HD-GYP domain-containing protein (c-di-GMP phosphodiesterase class II)